MANVDVKEARYLWLLLSDGQWKKQKDIDKHATDAEIQHSINDLRSRCAKMQTRAAALESVLFDRQQRRML
jgi:hypothetical protein